jgi:hypothetical protein
MNFDRKILLTTLLDLYKELGRDLSKKRILIPSGKVSKWFSGIGQEAIR